MDSAAVKGWVNQGILPDGEIVYSTLLKDDGLFDDAEGIYWDFKDEWPYSLSDNYFGGIARLICGFANSYGGVIVFGVHDKKRDGGRNKVSINLDKFSKALEQLLSSTPQFILRSYQNEVAGNIDVLLVRPRPLGVPPLRFKKSLGPYSAEALWVRVGNEVRLAEPSQYPVLFCRSGVLTDDDDVASLGGSIPPSPATLKQRFVGRTEVLDKLFQWLETSDDPRTYLHGKGGSGKTTIAYEFARLMKDSGSGLEIFGHEKLDAVIFMSAKEKSLSVLESKIIDTNSSDFSDEFTLLRAILLYGGWTRDEDYLNNSDIFKLRLDLKSFLDLYSVLIVVDDVDTLTTRGIDSGSEFLFKLLCRADRKSKVLYTLRNAPTQSLGNAIEVPGLDDNDYMRFVPECVDHFAVNAPTPAFVSGILSQISERRPLVIESIIALRRTAGNYERAVELFEQHTGDAIRDYVFLREWDAIQSNSTRLLLAALSEFAEPTTFADLQSVLQFEASAVSDAIGAVREMFLQIDDAGSSTLYGLAPLTKAFVHSKRSQLVGYNLLRQRVIAIKRHLQMSNPRAANIASQIDRLLNFGKSEISQDRLRDAYKLVTDNTLPPFVTQDPLFNVVRGYVFTFYKSARIGSIRDSFEYAISMKYEPDFRYLKAWFFVEKESGLNDGWCLKIADLVLQGKRYQEIEKVEMIGRKATSLFARAQERMNSDPSDAFKDIKEALRLHLRAGRLYGAFNTVRADTSERFARNTAYTLFSAYARSDVPWEFLDVLIEVLDGEDLYCDPLEGPLAQAFEIAWSKLNRIESLNRMRQRVKTAYEIVSHGRIWRQATVRDRTLACFKRFETQIDDGLRSLRQRSPT